MRVLGSTLIPDGPESNVSSCILFSEHSEGYYIGKLSLTVYTNLCIINDILIGMLCLLNIYVQFATIIANSH